MLINPYVFAPAGDPYFNNVVLLMHGDGANNSTSFVDSSASPVTTTAVGNAKISTAVSRFGGSSFAFDGTGDAILFPNPVPDKLRLGSSDFTIEFWVYTNGTGTYGIIGNLNDADGTGHYWVVLNSNFLGLHTVQFGTQVATARFGSSALATLSWTHVAVVRSGTSVRCFIDGIQLGSVVTVGTFSGSYSANYYMGANISGANIVNSLNGYIDELRITKGVARYTANFTPPTAPFPDL